MDQGLRFAPPLATLFSRLLRPGFAPAAPRFRACGAPVSRLLRPGFAPAAPRFRACGAPVSRLRRPGFAPAALQSF